VQIHGRAVALDKPEEIIAKKCFYRADGFTARDVFDLAVFLAKEPEPVRKHLPILTSRRDEIAARLEHHRNHPTMWEGEIGKVRALPGFEPYRQKPLGTVTRFYDDPQEWLQGRMSER